MNQRERIAAFVRRFPGMDDDEISAALQITPRQTVNQLCRGLEKAGLMDRRPNHTGKIGNYPIGEQTFTGAIAQESPIPVADANTDATKEWFWEGNVVDAAVKYLVAQGWQILTQADTKTKARGLDIHAVRINQVIMVEVKGYPSKSYRDPKRAGQQKPTDPTLQAKHWYSHAMLKIMQLHTSNPSAIAVAVFPDVKRYRQLFHETERALKQLGVAVLFVSEFGNVESIGL